MTFNTLSKSRLLYWLGPWSSHNHLPQNVEVQRVDSYSNIPPGRLYLPRGKQPEKCWIISPGMHFDGPIEARIHRFSMILAQTGALVFLPAIPDYMDLNFRPRALHDFLNAYDQLASLPITGNLDISIFSPSAGSLLAFQLAADQQRSSRIDRLLCFGAFVDPHAVFFHMIHGDSQYPGQRDPLNQPVAFLTLVDHLPGRPADTSALAKAWRRYVRSVWPDPSFKQPQSEKHLGLAHSIAQSLPIGERELFLIGCDARPGAWELAKEALDSCPADYEFLDPRTVMPLIKARVCAMHSTGDAVIPFSQLKLIQKLVPNAKLCPLNTYAHASALPLPALLRKGSGVVRDLATLGTIIDFICD